MSAGAMAGLAFSSKYSSGIVFLSVLAGILLWQAERRRKWIVSVLSTLSVLCATLVASPVLFLRTTPVFSTLRFQQQVYGNMASPSYWDQMFRRAEWDQPLEYPELKFLIASNVVDRPDVFETDIENYMPKNYKEQYEGLVNLRRALSRSLNIATIKVAEMTGLDKVVADKNTHFIEELGVLVCSLSIPCRWRTIY